MTRLGDRAYGGSARWAGNEIERFFRVGGFSPHASRFGRVVGDKGGSHILPAKPDGAITLMSPCDANPFRASRRSKGPREDDWGMVGFVEAIGPSRGGGSPRRDGFAVEIEDQEMDLELDTTTNSSRSNLSEELCSFVDNIWVFDELKSNLYGSLDTCMKDM
jgi:hypothetical protein